MFEGSHLAVGAAPDLRLSIPGHRVKHMDSDIAGEIGVGIWWQIELISRRDSVFRRALISDRDTQEGMVRVGAFGVPVGLLQCGVLYSPATQGQETPPFGLSLPD